MDSRDPESAALANRLLDPTAEPVQVSLNFLKSITNNFCSEQELGRGGYGVVYKGLLPCGSIIAVKKLKDKHPAEDDDLFLKEAAFLMGIKHQNVVQLRGYCAESKGKRIKIDGACYVLAHEHARVLCFEYMCNKGLDEYLSDEFSGLEWDMRYKIIKAICNGLHFLHELKIVHLDLKPQNILMDATMMPKIADFGLSRLLGDQKSQMVTANHPGTFGYMAPEYINKGVISPKADVFSFGVIIIEILTGRKDDYPQRIVPFSQHCSDNDRSQSTETYFQGFIDKVLGNWRNRFTAASKYTAAELYIQQVKQCITVALECVDPDLKKRPNTSDIVKSLNAAEGSCCASNGKDSLIDHPMGIQEGASVSQPVSMSNSQTPDRVVNTLKSAVAPPQPQSLACEGNSLAALRLGLGECSNKNYQGPRNASAACKGPEDRNREAHRTPRSSHQIQWCHTDDRHNDACRMATAKVGTLLWMVDKVLDSLTNNNLLKDWAASINLGPNVEALWLELSSVKALLHPFLGREIDDPALKGLLLRLQELGYDAEDVLDKLDYFRIEDMLYSNPTHTAFANTDEPPRLRFDRVDASKRMQHIVEQLQLVQQKVYIISTTLGSNLSTLPNIGQSRPLTISESIEPKLYGRDHIMNNIIHDITKGKHSAELLTVIPIVGPAGIGKTTLAQHIYHSRQVQQHFEVKVWTCVSLNFNVGRLIEEIGKYIPKANSEEIGTTGELIGQRLKNKRFLLVLDDLWDCSNEDEWEQLLVPFKKSQRKGNIIIVTSRFPAQAQIMVRKVDHSIYLQGLDDKEFKDLFLDFVFSNDQSRKDHTFLLEIGDKILGRLKGSPLAAKTVGRLLKTQLDLVHWTRVLESKEWEQSDGKNDIMHALKLSYDYLPSQLQLCFSYCALFPQDYKFEREELINFWIGLDVLHLSHYKNKRVEDIGLIYLIELINHGFLEKEGKKDGSACYIIHDLLHDLARKVSSHECLSIDSSQSQMSSLQVLPSIRHLSINIDDTSIKDRLSFKKCVEDFNTLDKRLQVQKLRSLVLFGEYHGSFVKAFSDLFQKAKALRVVFLSKASYGVEDLLHNFYNLLHLRYLRIQSSFEYGSIFPNKLSRFYHMMVIDAESCYIDNDLPIDVSNLVKLRHFLVQSDATHCSIAEVGKLKSLQELRRFVVKHEDQGFELRQIGHLIELCGSLCLDKLENVKENDEADEAKLLQKNRLRELILCWNLDRSTDDYTLQEHVLERLEPSNNLLRLSIIGHGGATCPSWLGTNLTVKSLESLCLDGVGWKTFPPIGELWLVNVPHGEISGNVPNKRFENLRRLELVDLPWLKKWAVHAPCQLFPFLEVLVIRGCSKLLELLFSHSACFQEEKDARVNLFPRLSKIEIRECPQLSSFPPFPWTEAPCSIMIEGIGSSCLHLLVLGEIKSFMSDCTIYGLIIEGNHNVSKVHEFEVQGCQSLPLHLSQTTSYVSVTHAIIRNCCASGKDLTQILTYFPKLSYLELRNCVKITRLGVMGQHVTATPGPSSSANSMHKQQNALSAEGLLLLPVQLKGLGIREFPELSLHSSSLDDNKEDGQTGQGGLQGMSSLRRLVISGCPKLLASCSSSSFSCYFPFPSSLECLCLEGTVGTEPLVPVPLSNLISLTSLSLSKCWDLRCEGLLSLVTQGYLTELNSCCSPNVFVGSEPSMLHDLELPSRSSKLKKLLIDDVAGVTATPICSLLCSNLAELVFYEDGEMERFTEEQETLLLANSLEEIRFEGCDSLQYLPARLHTLHNLKTLHLEFLYSRLRSLPDVLPSSLQKLYIKGCPEILSLPDRLPSSLQELYIKDCSEIRSLPDRLPGSLQKLVIEDCTRTQSLPKDGLPSSLQKLEIRKCPAIRSLPKVDDLPSSLQEINVCLSGSGELRRQCRELIGIIPIVKA